MKEQPQGNRPATPEECMDFIEKGIKRLTDLGCINPDLEKLRRDFAHERWRFDNQVTVS